MRAVRQAVTRARRAGLTVRIRRHRDISADEMSKAGTPIRYLRTAFVPESGQCMCLFESADAESVKALNREAQIPFDCVKAALDLTP